MTEDATAMATEVHQIVERVCPLLAGRLPQVQGAVLADLLAKWLAGHMIAGLEQVETSALHEELLKAHLDLVRRLIPVNAASIHGPS